MRTMTVLLNKVGTVLLWLGLAIVLLGLVCGGVGLLGNLSSTGPGPTAEAASDASVVFLIIGAPVAVIGFIVKAIFRQS